MGRYGIMANELSKFKARGSLYRHDYIWDCICISTGGGDRNYFNSTFIKGKI